MDGVQTLGLTAGASAPEALVQEMITVLAERYDAGDRGTPGDRGRRDLQAPRPPGVTQHALPLPREKAGVRQAPNRPRWRSIPRSPTKRIGRLRGAITTWARWWRSAASPKGVENSNFSLRTTAGDFILTLYEKRVDPAELPWFLGLMEHLARQWHHLPAAGAGRAGRQRSLRHPGRPPGLRHDLPARACGHAGCGRCIAPRWGTSLAALHLAGAWLCRGTAERAGARTGGNPLLDALPAPRRRGATRARRASQLTAALDRILAAWPAELPRGHIHADLFPDNVFFLDGKPVRPDRLLLRRDRSAGL